MFKVFIITHNMFHKCLASVSAYDIDKLMTQTNNHKKSDFFFQVIFETDKLNIWTNTHKICSLFF